METPLGRIRTIRLNTYRLILAFAVLTGTTSLTYGEDDDLNNIGTVFGWVIGCDFFKYSEATIIEVIEASNMNSDSEMKKLKSGIDRGKAEIEFDDDSEQFCSSLYYGPGRELVETIDSMIDRWKQTSDQPL